MVIETKKCPFCAEEINAEAIKCKFCGEFLNNETKNEKEKVISRLIEQKDYSLGIFLAFLAIALSFLDTFIEDNEKLSVSILFLTLLIEIRVWLYFRQYIQNFNSGKSKRLISWYIVLLTILSIFIMISDYLPNSKVKLRTEARYFDSKEAIFFDNKSNNFFVTTSLSFEF